VIEIRSGLLASAIFTASSAEPGKGGSGGGGAS
jgi:hypothetical protein